MSFSKVRDKKVEPMSMNTTIIAGQVQWHLVVKRVNANVCTNHLFHNLWTFWLHSLKFYAYTFKKLWIMNCAIRNSVPDRCVKCLYMYKNRNLLLRKKNYSALTMKEINIFFLLSDLRWNMYFLHNWWIEAHINKWCPCLSTKAKNLDKHLQ